MSLFVRSATAALSFSINEGFLDRSNALLLSSHDEENLQKVIHSLKTLFQMTLEKATKAAEQILKEQQGLGPGRATVWQTKIPLIITKDFLYFQGNLIGEGTFSKVYASHVLATEHREIHGEVFSPSKPKVVALKRSKSHLSYSPEKRKLDRVTETDGEGLDLFYTTSKDSDGHGYAMCKRYQRDLTHASFVQFDQPVSAILQTLVSCARGLAKIHFKNHVHRDVKGGNILVTEHGKVNQDDPLEIAVSFEGVISDFGFMQEENSAFHRTTGTPDYLDPSMFGSLEMCLLNQKRRVGRQTKEGDIYAFGMTIYCDLLKKFILEMGKKSSANGEVVELIAKIRTITKHGPFTDEDLRSLGMQSNYRAVYLVDERKNEKLVCYPRLEYIHEIVKRACLKLKNTLSDREVEALIRLSRLSCDMQTLDWNIRPSIDKVIEELVSISDDLGKTPLKRLQSEDRDSTEPEDTLSKRARTHANQEEREPEFDEGVPTSMGFSEFYCAPTQLVE